MSARCYKKGQVLFQRGDLANEMFFVVSGSYLVAEIGVSIHAGQVVGELGFVARHNRRTQTE
jgi:CRP-like cAMP-binding protein